MRSSSRGVWTDPDWLCSSAKHKILLQIICMSYTGFLNEEQQQLQFNPTQLVIQSLDKQLFLFVFCPFLQFLSNHWITFLDSECFSSENTIMF